MFIPLSLLVVRESRSSSETLFLLGETIDVADLSMFRVEEKSLIDLERRMCGL